MLLGALICWSVFADSADDDRARRPVVKQTERNPEPADEPTAAEEPVAATAPQIEPKPEKPPEAAPRARRSTEPPVQFTGTIDSSSKMYTHRFDVAPAFPVIVIDPATLHLGDRPQPEWTPREPQGTSVTLKFDFPADAPDTSPTLSIELFACRREFPVLLNGKPFGALPVQAEAAFTTVQWRLPRGELLTGENELRFATTPDDKGVHGNVLLKNVRLSAEYPRLYRVELSRLPGADTRLQCFRLEGDERISQFELNNVLKEGEEIHSNWAAAPGSYELQVGADGVNPDVEYLLELDPLEFVTAHHEREPNDAPAQATPILFDKEVAGYTPWGRDIDYFDFTMEQAGYVRIDLKAAPQLDLALSVHNARNTQLRVVDASEAGEGEKIRHMWLAEGQHRILVQSKGHLTANLDQPYQLLLRRAAEQPGFEIEPNDHSSLATTVELGQSMRGRHEPAGEVDWFQFEVPEQTKMVADPRRIVRVRVTSLDGVEYQVRLSRDQDRQMAWGNRGEDYAVTNWLVAPGAAKIGVAGRQVGKTVDGQSYRLKVEVLDRAEAGYAVGNDTPDGALTRTVGQPFRSCLYPWQNSDYYKMTFTSDDIVYRLRDVRRSLRRGLLGIELQDATRTPILQLTNSTIENWTPRPGEYYFKVFRRNTYDRSAEHYELRLEEQRVVSRGEEREFNDAAETASVLPCGTDVVGWFAPVGDVDWYRIEIPPEASDLIYAIELKSKSTYADLRMQIIAADGTTPLRDVNDQPVGKAERLEDWSFAPGVYYVTAAVANAELQKNIRYTLRCEETGRQKAGAEFEPNNELAQGTPLKLDLLSNGRCASRNDVDFFALHNPAKQAKLVQFRLNSPDQAHDVCIVNEAGETISPIRTTLSRNVDFQNYVLGPDKSLFVKVVAGRLYSERQAGYVLKALDRGDWNSTVEREPNGDGLPPTDLVADTTVRGMIPRRDDVDWYEWTSPQDDRFQRLIIEPPAQQVLRAEAYFQPNDGERWKIFLTNVDRRFELPNFRRLDGRVLLKITSSQPGDNPYTIRLETQPQRLAQNDIEPDDVQPLFKPLTAGTSIEGAFYHDGDYDNYLVEGDGRSIYNLHFASRGDQRTRLEIIPLVEDGATAIKTIDAYKTEQVMRFWRPAAIKYWVRLRAYRGVTYTLRLEQADPQGLALELNDRWQEATPIALGADVRGLLDVPNDHDNYHVHVAAEQGEMATLQWQAPSDTDVYWTHLGPNGSSTRRVVPAGKTLTIANAWLGQGDHYFGVAWRRGAGEYKFSIDAAEPYEPNRGYQIFGAQPRQQLATDAPIQGSLIPFDKDGDEYTFDLVEPSSVRIDVSGLRGANVILSLREFSNQDWRAANDTGKDLGESYYEAFLKPGRYVVNVTATALPDARDYTLRLRTGPAGFFFAPPRANVKRNLAHRAFGGRIVRATSEYNAGWTAANLLDGDTLTAGWCSVNTALPQEVVIGFLNNRPIQIDQISINPRAHDNPNHWAREVEVLVSSQPVAATAQPDNEKWVSLGTVQLAKEDAYHELNLDSSTTASAVMLRMKTNHGGSYFQLGEVRIREAVASDQSPLSDQLAVALEQSRFAGDVNLLSAHLGGRVASFSSQDNDEWSANNLIDGKVITPFGWRTKVGVAEPAEVVLELPAVAPLARLAFSNRLGYESYYRKNRIKDLEIWLSSESATTGFEKIATVRLDEFDGWKSFQLPQPRNARWIKLRGLSNYGGAEVSYALGEVMAFAEPGAAKVNVVKQSVGDAPVRLPGALRLDQFDRAFLGVDIESNGAGKVSYQHAIDGQGVTYADLTAGNQGTVKDRVSDVDINSDDEGPHLANVLVGEWTEYSVEVAKAGRYVLKIKAAAQSKKAALHIEVDGEDRTGSLVIPSPDAGATWQEFETKIDLTPGKHRIRVALDKNDPASALVWLQSISFRTE